MRRQITGLWLIALLATGCASGGNDFFIDRADLLEPGKTTYDEAVELLKGPNGGKNAVGQTVPGIGEPVSRTYNDDGTVTYRWVSTFASAIGGLVWKLELLFDEDGVLIREVYREKIE